MRPVLYLGQRVDPGVVQQVLGDTNLEVKAGPMQRVVSL